MHLSMLSWSSFKQYSTWYSFQATDFFPTNPLSKHWTAVREEQILLQWILSILRKNICQAGHQTSDLWFSSPVSNWLSYGAIHPMVKTQISIFQRYMYFWWGNKSLLRQCRYKIGLHVLCSLILIYTVHKKVIESCICQQQIKCYSKHEINLS